jgi:fluoroacetyl-CoA thioesterase
MANLTIGTKGEFKMLVTNEVAIDFLGMEEARVLGTPWLIAHLEWTCRNSVKPLLDEGYDTVGTHVDVRHLAATPMGMQVTFRSELVGIEGNRLRFVVEAYDEKDKIASGTHERAMINIAKFATRLQAKMAS